MGFRLILEFVLVSVLRVRCVGFVLRAMFMRIAVMVVMDTMRQPHAFDRRQDEAVDNSTGWRQDSGHAERGVFVPLIIRCIGFQPMAADEFLPQPCARALRHRRADHSIHRLGERLPFGNACAV